MGEGLELPDEVYGFGSWLLWVLATRATSVVDVGYAAGPARPSRHYGMVDGHPVPTPSLVAWLLTAAEFDVPLDRLAQRDPRLDERQKVLRTIVSRAIGGEPRLFKDRWLHQLAAVCGLGMAELDLLFRCRDDEGYPVDPHALRKAIAQTFRSGSAAGDRTGNMVSARQVVVGEIPREPPGFVARETLARLADAAGRGLVAVVCAVTGLRGVGKTQLAAAYARDRIAEGWGLVGWVNAETADMLLAGLARVAERLGVADPDGDSGESARRLREHLQVRAARGLLVLDNAADADRVRRFLPATGGTQVVITSTDQAFTELGEAVDVAVFTREESLAFLEARTRLADDIGAGQVAAELGDWPLGLAQAAATIRRQHLTYPVYLERLRQVPVAALLGSVPGGDYPHPAAAALLLSIQSTEGSDPAGVVRRLLQVMAVLSPDGVRRGLLADLVSPDGEEEVDTAIERCVAGSLLAWSVTGDAVIMHRLLGRVLRERDQAESCWADTVTTALVLLEPRLFAEDQAWARRDQGAHLVAQVEALWAAAGAGAGAENPELSLRELQARCWAVRQLRAAADLNRAIDLGTRVLADCRRILGVDHRVTLTAGNDLAEAYRQSGRMEQAIALHEQTLAAREQILGNSHPDTLTSRDRLAAACATAGRLDQAITLHEQTLSSREQVLGADHPDTLVSRNHLASAHLYAGHLDQAIALFEQVIDGRERVLGSDHPETISSRNNLGAAYELAGRPQQAVLLHKGVLADRERILGADHPDTLVSRNNLAMAYRLAGMFDQAIPLLQENLAERTRVLGPDHPSTLISLNNLAHVYGLAGRFEEAAIMLEQALADYDRVLGAEHPYTLTARGNLAFTYVKMGRVAEAIQLAGKTLADRERILGCDHPDTLRSRDYLAEGYAAAGQLERAIPLHEQTLADRKRIRGPDHPDTLRSRHNLAAAYAAAGRLERAISLYERTLADRISVLGDTHPDTIATRDSLEHAKRKARSR